MNTPRSACQWVSFFVGLLESARNGPTGAGLVAWVYTMPAMPAITTMAVKPYHQLFWRERFADRTAARLRFAREALVTPGRLAADGTPPGRAPGVLSHRQNATRREIQRRERQQYHSRAGETAPSESPRGPMVLDKHPVWTSRRARALDMRDGA